MKIYLTNFSKLLLLAVFAVSINAEYKLGKDYRLVDNPLPVKRDGIVEVTESFWYGCAHCYSFEPAINSWESKQSDDTKLTKMPITWGPIHQLHAALFFTIEALKLDASTHSAVFVTIHKEGNFLQSPKAIQDFLSKFGVAPEVTAQYLDSFTVKQKVNRGIKYARQLKISSVPMIVVDGTYIVESKGSFSDMLKVVDHLVELQRPNS
jgi:thiol:disulfide interchange protein DsbA|tara:strand:- start:1351 stop:1974 length:624 start_codon:yes stop_codon:yes gene_type:complete